MDGEKWYLTEDDLVFAEKNGIPRKNVRFRVQTDGWPVEKAITMPVRTVGRNKWKEWEAIATLNGISYHTYYKRVRAGLSPEDAATKRLQIEKRSKSYKGQS